MKLSIDDLIHVDINNCYTCGEVLTETNISIWKVFAKINGEIVTVNQCKRCAKKDTEEFKKGVILKDMPKEELK